MLPFLTAYDPPGTSEGTIDPLGLYQIAEHLAVQLVPAVRERMLRARFLTCMVIGALVTEGVDDVTDERDAAPYLVWEWLVILALVRAKGDDSSIWGCPGTLVARRALDQLGYLDARSYLKTPRIFGIYGVYKRLAMHLGLVDVHLAAGPNAEGLADAWAKDRGLGGVKGFSALKQQWTDAVQRSMEQKPRRTRTRFQNPDWELLASFFAPADAKAKEKRYLRDRLFATTDRGLGALHPIWELQGGFDDGHFLEETLHDRLEKREPAYGALLHAVRSYEAFARSLHDAFDVLKAEAARPDGQGFVVTGISNDRDFAKSVEGLHQRFSAAHRALSEITFAKVSLPNLFSDRFGVFAEPMDAGTCAIHLCAHHEAVQRGKSADGKRPWFDRIGADRIYVRHDYRAQRVAIRPRRYVHDYRGWPIRRFFKDLS